MPEDVKTEPQEQPAPEESMGQILAIARAGKACIVEHHVCPKCRRDQFLFHHWSETLKCIFCGHAAASAVPRPPRPGEVTAEHMAQAIATYQEAYAAIPLGGEVEPEDFQQLPPGIQNLVNRQSLAFARTVLGRVQRLAVTLAGGA